MPERDDQGDSGAASPTPTPLTINQPVLQSPPVSVDPVEQAILEPFDPGEADRLADVPIPDDDEDQ